MAQLPSSFFKGCHFERPAKALSREGEDSFFETPVLERLRPFAEFIPSDVEVPRATGFAPPKQLTLLAQYCRLAPEKGTRHDKPRQNPDHCGTHSVANLVFGGGQSTDSESCQQAGDRPAQPDD
jgi:hypothetical protein